MSLCLRGKPSGPSFPPWRTRTLATVGGGPERRFVRSNSKARGAILSRTEPPGEVTPAAWPCGSRARPYRREHRQPLIGCGVAVISFWR
ncbi:hypothetical protein ACFFX0_25585 [Citricoccus parietis]|uniref:Uncharacterized protein n=1 Tax=Citricoccus parietis TaxID=592307 RepID=A0ABV5G613_9MICC